VRWLPSRRTRGGLAWQPDAPRVQGARRCHDGLIFAGETTAGRVSGNHGPPRATSATTIVELRVSRLGRLNRLIRQLNPRFNRGSAPVTLERGLTRTRPDYQNCPRWHGGVCELPSTRPQAANPHRRMVVGGGFARGRPCVPETAAGRGLTRRRSTVMATARLPERAGIGSRPNSPRAADVEPSHPFRTAEKKMSLGTILAASLLLKCHCLCSEQDTARSLRPARELHDAAAEEGQHLARRVARHQKPLRTALRQIPPGRGFSARAKDAAGGAGGGAETGRVQACGIVA